MKLRILQISNRVPWPLNEGGTIGIYNFTRAFAEAGHEVTLYCLDGLKHKTPVEEAKQNLQPFCKQLYIQKIDTDFKAPDAIRALLRNRSYNVSRFENETFELAIEELLREEQFDVVQLEGTFAGPYYDVVRRNHNGIISVRMHNVEYEIWHRLALNSKNLLKKVYFHMLSRALRKYEANLVSKAHVVACVTAEDRDKFRKLSEHPAYLVIPAGTDLNTWQFSPTFGYRNWYHLGSMEWHANREAVEWFTQNVYAALNSELGIQLHLGGKGINKEEFSSDIKVYPVVHNAFTFIRDLDVCVVPLLSGSGIRVKILEAMAAGKLVIASTVGAQGIEALNGIHLLIADSPEDYRKIAADLKNGSIDVKLIVENARKLIEEKYSIKAASDSLLQFYSQAMG